MLPVEVQFPVAAADTACSKMTTIAIETPSREERFIGLSLV